MKFGVISSAQLSAGPDNPSGRWDAAYHLFIAQVNKGSADEAGWLGAVTGDVGRDAVKRLRNASTVEEIHAALLRGLRLEVPSQEVYQGLAALAARIARQRVTSLETDIQTLQTEADRLRQSLPAE